MPSAAHLRIVNLRKWFPPDDPLAAKIARLWILREDLLLEMQGIYVEDLKELDEYSVEFRGMYVLRNLIRTQMELSGAIQRLLGTPQFQVLLKKQPPTVKKLFQEGVAIIAKAHPTAKDVRNDICGHVREAAVQLALDRMNPESWAFLDVGKTANLTHYKFAGEVTAEILLKGMSKEERTIVSSKYATIARLTKIFGLIEHCFVMYAEDRGLL